MRTRLVEFLNTTNYAVEYGVKVYFRNKWCLLAENGKPFIAKTAEEVEVKRKAIRKEKWTW